MYFWRFCYHKILNLNLGIVNDQDIKKLISCDPILVNIFDMYGSPPDWHRPQGFVSLCRIILEQQVSLASANAHYLKLNHYVSAFTPEALVKLSDEEMRACQISRQKATYIRALSDSILKGDIDLEGLQELTESEVRERLIRIKGIGNWTIDVYLMFCLRSKDIFSYRRYCAHQYRKRTYKCKIIRRHISIGGELATLPIPGCLFSLVLLSEEKKKANRNGCLMLDVWVLV